MDNSSQHNTQSSADNARTDEIDKMMLLTEADLLVKYQELKRIESSLNQRELALEQNERNIWLMQESISKSEAELNEKHIRLTEQELQAKNGFPNWKKNLQLSKISSNNEKLSA